MPRGARIAGWVYFPIHAVVLPLTLGMLLLAVLGKLPSDVTCNVLYYLCGLVFTLIAMWRFLRRSFDTMVGSILRCLGMMFAAYGIDVLLSLVLLVLPLFIGKETYGAKNWFYVGGISVQPSEIVKLTLIIVRFREMIFSSPAMKKTYTSQTSSVTPATRRCIFQMAEKVRLRASRSSRTRAISRGP